MIYMMSLTAKLRAFRDLMKGVTANFYHYYRPHRKGMHNADHWLVWSEISEDDSPYLDNQKTEQVLTGTLDFYTMTEYDARIDTIQEKLQMAPVTRWELVSAGKEEETGLIHYSWSWRM